jgi:hypothetical protein
LPPNHSHRLPDHRCRDVVVTELLLG